MQNSKASPKRLCSCLKDSYIIDAEESRRKCQRGAEEFHISRMRFEDVDKEILNRVFII